VLARAGIGYVPEGRRIFTGLTVAENLEVGRRRSSDAAAVWTTERVYALFPALAELRHRRGGQLSGGEQQMLTIARTLMGNPRLLLLDEPVTGLAPKIANDLAAAVRALRDHGLTILVSEQSLAFAAAVADFALVLETGRLRWQGAMADFVADAAAQQALLGI
jgi:branched-chain amino acid transport system ATP-binding protein